MADTVESLTKQATAKGLDQIQFTLHKPEGTWRCEVSGTFNYGAIREVESPEKYASQVEALQAALKEYDLNYPTMEAVKKAKCKATVHPCVKHPKADFYKAFKPPSYECKTCMKQYMAGLDR